MPRKSNVWKYFTRSTDASGKKATCNQCAHEIDYCGGTTNMWRHYLKHFTQGDEDDTSILKCNICQSKLKASAAPSSLIEHILACIEQQKAATVGTSAPSGSGSTSMDPQHADQGAQPPPFDPSNINHVEHFAASIEQQDAAAAGTSHPPPVQTSASPGSGPTTSMDIETARPQAQPLLPVQTCAPGGSGTSSMDLEPADLGAQLPPLPSAPSCPAASSSGGEPGMDEPSKHLARMIALDGYDPSIVDNDCFRSVLGSLKPELAMPSRVEIEKECNRVFDEARSDLLSRLRSSRGNVCLALGRTKTVDKDVIYITCHFIDEEWMLHKLVIGACLHDDMDYDDPYWWPSSGLLLFPYGKLVMDYAHEIINIIISEHGISNRLFMLAANDAANDQFWCVDLFDTNTSTREIFFSIYVEKKLHSIARCFFPLDFRLDLSKDMDQLYLTKEKNQQLISHLDPNDPLMYDGERWYQWYCFLKVLLMDNTMIGGRKHHANEEYGGSILECLCKFLGKIHHAIQRISAPSCPTSHLYLEELHKIRKFLKSEPAYDIAIMHPIVANGLWEAIETLDEAIKGSYLVWSIPLALDPRYKLKHICSISLEAFEPRVAIEYYSKVRKKITDLYHDYKTDEVGTSTGAGHSDSGVVEAAGGADCHDPMHQWWWERGWDWPAELKRYIRDPIPPADDFDVLKWWKRNSQKYPTLARMARDALAMPTCSKPSSDEIAQIKSIVRGYSQKPFG